MKIGVDLDGIVANIDPPLRRAIVDKLNIDLWADGGPTTFWIQKEPRVLSIPGGEEFINSLFMGTFIYENAALVPFSVPSLNLLRDQGHEIWVITARPDTVKKATINWLEKNGLKWAVEKLIICDATMANRSTTKLETCKKLDIKLLIDDHASTLKTICEAMNIPGLLIEYPWNIHEDAGKMATYCKDWNEILKIIGSFVKETSIK